MFETRTSLQGKFNFSRANQILLLLVFLLNVLVMGSMLNGAQITSNNIIANKPIVPITTQTTVDPGTKQQIQNDLEQFNDGFQAQTGQGDSTIAYFISNPSITVGFGTSTIKMLFKDGSGKDYTEITMSFPKGNVVSPQAKDPMVSKATFFIGSSIGKSRQEYGTIVYKNIFPHIDLEYTIKNGQLKYNFYVYPGGNPSIIKMHWSGPVVIQQISTGMKLTVTTKKGQISFFDQRPLSFQPGDSAKIKSNFKITGDQSYGFTIDKYDTRSLLIIDPAFFMFSTYLGGSSYDTGFGIAVDSLGNVYITGETQSTNFPTLNAYNNTYQGGTDGFVAKFSSTGILLYSTYLGGSGIDIAESIAVDSLGYVYITGNTQSTNFPTLNAYQSTFGGSQDAFVSKLSSTGSLLYSTYLGGLYTEEGYGIAVDSLGNVLVTGETQSTNFPTVNAYNSTFGGSQDVFVAKFSSTGTLLYSTYLGGSSIGYGYDIAVDSLGNAYVTGATSSNNFPIVNAYNNTYGGGYDVFVAKFSSTGSLLYSTYLGGSNTEYGNSIAVDSLGNTYVTGSTDSTNFPTLNAYQSTFRGSQDSYVAKFSPTGSLLYSSYIGGSNTEYGASIAVDSLGNAFITGFTISNDFPTLNAYNSTFGGSQDAYVAKFSPTGSLLYSTYIGGSGSDRGFGIAVDSLGNAYIAGFTSSTNFPTMNAFNIFNMGGVDTFVSELISQANSSFIPSSVIVSDSTTSHSLSINWNSPTFTDSLSQYFIYRSSDSVSFNLIGTSSSTDFIDYYVTPGVLYQYIISADYSFGSYNTTPTTGALPTVPSAPSLQANMSSDAVLLTWNQPSNGYSTIQDYQIYRGTESGQYTYIGTTQGLKFNDSTVLPGTTYYYVVDAVNSVGTGNFSNDASVTIPGQVSSSSSTILTVVSTSTVTAPSSALDIVTLAFFGGSLILVAVASSVITMKRRK